MGFDEAIYRCLAKSMVFSGRARASEFWWFTSLFLGATALAIGALALAPRMTAIAALPMQMLAPAMFSVTVRRLHDIGLSGWTLLFLVPVLGQAVMIVWLTRPGIARANRHGPEASQAPEHTLLYAP